MKKISMILTFLLISTSAYSQINNCIIPGFPGCSPDDFNRALREQQQLQMQQQYLNEMRRNNQLLQEQLELQRQMQLQQQLMPNPVQQYNQQRCLTAPLLTPGC